MAVVLGLIALLVSPLITGGSWETPPPVIGVAVAVVLVVGGSLVREFLVTGAGVLGLFVYLPMTLGACFGEALGAPVLLLASGTLLLVVMFVLLHARHGPGHPRGSGPPIRPAVH